MAPDYPSDLIHDIKIRLRQAAGVPSYDPGDPDLPSVPSVADVVAALDPTLPDYLRCKRCHGGLFRGINSTLCIFCGAEQRGEGISRKISFNSTAAYRNLLQSLDLDGSEMVDMEAESKESSKGHDSPKGGVTLANFLDLELRWPGEVEELDNNSGDEAPSQVALVSLSAVDLDNFFSDQKIEPLASAHGASSLSFDLDTFLSGTRTETASSAQNGTLEQFTPRKHGINTHDDYAKGGDSDDAFADWETDFQSASSATFEAKFKQIDPVQSSEDFRSANRTSVAAAESRSIDLFHNSIDYQSANYETTESKNSSNFQPDNPTALSKDSRTNDLFQNSSTDSSPIMISKSEQNAYLGHNSSKDDTAQDLSHEVDQLASRNDWFQGDMLSRSGTKISKETDKLESISNTFLGELKNEENETTSLSVSWTRDDLWQSTANEINNTKSLNHHDDDLFDDWQDFTTATNASGNSPILQSLTSDEVRVLPSEANSGESEDFEFGRFVQSDSFSVPLNDLQSGDDSIARRTNQSNGKTGNAPPAVYSGSNMVENIRDASDLDPSRSKVDAILAQMPDLSFMLEDSLHIPKNPSS